ncbi:hypothetical protein [Deinococcus sp. SL84]|uniref:hypothetical protein n=1 Tax=Deinococcus sp. SL84 TaxID=2994663 RepID=UPI0022759B81|nr:hypothetical protein [Deinococcus sp. SL84]MCY1704351.1 hypothetical protein [Deinococcus sp. SL84]
MTHKPANLEDLAELAAEVAQLEDLRPIPAPSIHEPKALRRWLKTCAELMRQDWQASRADRLERLAQRLPR